MFEGDPLALDELHGLAQRLHNTLERLSDLAFYRPLRIRVRELGENAPDEQQQFRQLQKACRRDAKLVERLIAAGFPNPLEVDVRQPRDVEGLMIQAFNHLIETWWEM